MKGQATRSAGGSSEDEPGGSRKWRIGVAIGLAGLALAVLVPVGIAECWLGVGSCPAPLPEVRIDIPSSMLNAPGYDNPSDEYICLVNADDVPVNLTDWKLREGNGDLVNTLPSFSLAAGAEVRVHPGEGRDSAHDIFGTSGRAVWTNSGDSVTLVDASGEEIASTSYGSEEEHRPASACG